ncbi:MAG: DUF1848 domain-containing protein [bacterium]|nr:DUF1848 domain-containing protein [bacterium]
MIISASRRTDIPTFYSRWFFNRLDEGFVMVRNPMNPSMVSKIDLTPDLIDCIVFWTKYPRPMMKHLERLNPYPFYFLFTITPYDKDLELHLPHKDKIIDTFIELSQMIGKERVIWRYDPVILSDTLDEDYHYHHFNAIARRLQSHTGKCIFSFLDMYKKCERNLKGFNISEAGAESMNRIATMISRTAKEYGIQAVTCAEPGDYTNAGAPPGKCIDDHLISRILGYRPEAKKDRYQRKTCGCIESIDIGAYNSCNHICLYCYANVNIQSVKKNIGLHNPRSPLLIGELKGNEKITERQVSSFKTIQPRLF